MPTAYIDVDMCKVVLAARKTSTNARWAAMSTHVETQDCRHHATPYRIARRSLAGPMQRGSIYRVAWLVASRGAKEFRKTFGIGVRAWKTENHYLMERQS
ncbi:MAG TPA: hypothetical protein PLQ85_04910 [Anaerolineae bacterium]|nr:hypothetical protein [Anaerolineae bacterium]